MKIHWLVKVCLLIIAIVIIDQLTKYGIRTHYYWGETTSIIPNLFNITYVKNTGAAFGFMADAHLSIRQILFLLIPVVACGWLIYLVAQTRDKNWILTTSYSMILAGAIGNLIDRFYLGFVVDFLDFFFKDAHFPAFNVADSSITIAAFLLILDYIIVMRKNKNATNID